MRGSTTSKKDSMQQLFFVVHFDTVLHAYTHENARSQPGKGTEHNNKAERPAIVRKGSRSSSCNEGKPLPVDPQTHAHTRLL